MKIIELTKKEQLDNFVSSQKHSQFLQSWEWGEFQKKVGRKVIRLGIEEDREIKFAVQIIKNSLPLGRAYFYAPRISVKALDNEELKFLFTEIEKLAKKENAIFLRFEPTELKVESLKLKFEKTLDVQASKTLILDISRSEEEILNTMHQKTRYNIRLAEKKGVLVRVGSKEDFDSFWKIMKETEIRDKFRLHPRNYYQAMINLENIKLLVAEYNSKIIAGVIVSFFGDMGLYVHGASANEYRNVMAPHALQWKAIKIAKEKGRKYYDFNGVDENKWSGVTRFKKGFSRLDSARQAGDIIEYPGTFDLAFNSMWYNVYKITRKIRRLV